VAGGTSKIWVMRMPGGMTKIIKSDKPITEQDAKDIYVESFKYKIARQLIDIELVWPVCKAIDEAEMNRQYAQLIIPAPVSGRFMHLVEV